MVSEACLLLGDLAFNQYNFHRLYAYSYAHNAYSQKALESGGFQYEGVFKEHVFDQKTQTFVDLKIFGMTEAEFRQNQRLVRLSQRLVGRDITQKILQVPSQLPQPTAQPPPIYSFRQTLFAGLGESFNTGNSRWVGS